jgi:uncharacterized protein (TIGR03382 family)
MKTKYLIAATVVGLAASSAMAQSRSSFLVANNISGITVTNQGGNSYKVSVANGATFTYNSVAYTISAVFGVWALGDANDVTGSTSSFGVWNANSSNAGTGGILGWKTNPNSGIAAAGTQTFTFNSLGAFDRFGFHVTTTTAFPGTTGVTGYITTPTPGATALLGLGGLVMTRRRR